MHLPIHHPLNIIAAIHLMMMMMMTLMLGQVGQSSCCAILDACSTACGPLACGSTRCCGGVGSGISVPVLRASVVVDVDGDCSLIWEIELRLAWGQWLGAVVGARASVVRVV